MDSLIVFIFFLLLRVIDTLEILEDVPEPKIVELGTTGSVVLECDYDVTEEGEKAQLEIKWYFNDDPSPFLMWVPSGGRKPQLIGSQFENHVDLDYVASEDHYKAYSSLRLVNPTTKMSGSYICKVSTFENEEYQERSLVIYSQPDEIVLAYSLDDEEETDLSEEKPQLINLTCLIKGIYPQPQVQLIWKQKSDSGDTEIEGSGTFSEAVTDATFFEDEGLYDVLVHYTIEDQDVVPGDSSKEDLLVGCELMLPDVEYHRIEYVTIERKTKTVESDESGSGEPCEESSGCDVNLDFSGSGSGLDLEMSGSGSGCEWDSSGCGLEGSAYLASGSGSGDDPEMNKDYQLVTEEEDIEKEESDSNGEDEGPTSGCEKLSTFQGLFIFISVIGISWSDIGSLSHFNVKIT